MDTWGAIAAIAGAVITGLFAVIAVLLRKILDQQPTLDAPAENIINRLDKLHSSQQKIRKTQAIILTRVQSLEDRYCELRASDDALLEIMSEREKPK